MDPDTDERKRRIARWQEIPSQSRPLMERLVSQRLLVQDRRRLGDGEEATVVEEAHEALLRQWPLLSGWLDEDADALKTIHAAKRAAAEWIKNGHNPAWLAHRGERRRGVEELLQRAELDRLMGDEGRAYVRACRKQDDIDAAEAARLEREAREKEQQALETEKRRAEVEARRAKEQAEAARRISRRTAIGAAVAVVLMVVAGWMVWEANQQEQVADSAREEALEKTKEAERSLANNLWALGISAEEKNDPVTAAHFFARATQKYSDETATKTGRLKLQAIQRLHNTIALGSTMAHDGAVRGACFPPMNPGF